MVIYLDILFINNTLMTYVIIWAVAKILGYKRRWWRFLLAAISGTFYTFIILYIDSLDLSTYCQYIYYTGLNIITAVLIIFIAFGKLSIPRFIKAIGYLYLTSFICIGTILSVIYIFGIEKINNTKVYLFLALGLFVLLLLGNKGWKIFHSYLTPDNLILPLKIYLHNNELQVKGLIDTGNSLRDPLTNSPVIITEFKYISTILPFKVQQQLKERKEGIMDIISIFAESDMAERVRVLPFSDLGQEHGMLVGFRPDKIEIICKEQKIERKNILLALTDNILDEDGIYQALINPRIIN